MILITGSTGFIGRVLVRQLAADGRPMRVLLRPSRHTPRLPRGIPVEVTVASLTDARGLDAALQGVDTVYHLAGDEGAGSRANLHATDIEGTRLLAHAAARRGVQRFFYISHYGASTASAFPVLRAKGLAEQAILSSGVPYTIFRAAAIFGPGDQLTNGLSLLLALAPGFLPLPAGGKTRLQPLWVEDLAACMAWALDNENTRNQVLEVGGTEYYTLAEIVAVLQSVIGIRKRTVNWPQPLMRGLTVALENALPGFPFSSFWLDYLAVDRIGPVDTLPRLFNLLPETFHPRRLSYLRTINWRKEAWRRLLRRQTTK